MTTEEQTGQLFAAVRRGKLKPGMAGEFAKRVAAEGLPVVRKMDGLAVPLPDFPAETADREISAGEAAIQLPLPPPFG